MLKRFVIGFVIGVAAMHWYIVNGGEVFSEANSWFSRSSSKYSGQKTHDAARDLIDTSRR